MKKIYHNFYENLQENYRNFFYFIPFLFACGVGFYFALAVEPSQIFYEIVAFIFLLSCWFFYRASLYKQGVLIRAVTGGMGVFLFGFGCIAFQAHHEAPFPALPSEAVWIEGTVYDQRILPVSSGKNSAIFSEIKREELTLKEVQFLSPWYERKTLSPRYLRVNLKPFKKRSSQEEMIGKRVKIRVLCHHVMSSSWPYGRDLQKEAYFSNMMGSASALSAPKILPPISSMIVEKRRYDSLKEKWLKMRLNAAHHFLILMPNQEGAVIATLLFGDTEMISPQTRKEFAASGLSHLLAVAGLHLGIVMGVIFTFVSFITRRCEWIILRFSAYFIASFMSLLGGFFYIALTGFHVPALRAFGGALFFLLAFIVQKRSDGLRILAFIALILEISSPFIVTNIAFQMSFASVMCLLSALKRQRDFLRKKAFENKDLLRKKRGIRRILSPFLKYVGEMMRISCLAALPTIPLSMAYFGSFQPLFLIANMIAIPLMGFWIMPFLLLGLLFWTCPFLSIVSYGCFFLSAQGISVVLALAHWVTSLPFASFEIASFPSWGVILYFLGLCFFCLWRGRMRYGGVALIFLACLSPFLIARPSILIAPDYGVIGVYQQGKLFVGPHKNAFIGDLWARDMAAPLESLTALCPKGTNAFCHLTIGGKEVVFSLGGRNSQQGGVPFREGDALIFCQNITLFIDLSVSRSFCPHVPMIDKEAILHDGSWALYERGKEGWDFVSGRHIHGARLWNTGLFDPGMAFAREE